MIRIGKKKFDQKNALLAISSILLLGFGSASALWWLSPLTAVIGYALAFGAVFATPPGKGRLIKGWALFSVAILIQSSWLLSHPFLYIWGVWIILSLLLALPYALLTLQVVSAENPTLLASLGLAAAFALVEWGFTCLPCGYSFQSAALLLTWSPLPLQLASIIGGIGLSFLAFWTNIVMFHWLFLKKRRGHISATIIAALPYLLGGGLFWHHTRAQSSFDKAHPPISVAFCHMEEPPDVHARPLGPEKLHEQEWEKIFSLLSSLKPNETDLIVLPEGAAPFSAEAPLFDSSHLPAPFHTPQHMLLSSLDLSRLIATSYNASVLIGLEGRERAASYNSCFFISKNGHTISRYDKQLLLPLGEYIPTPLLRSFLSSYGIHESFTSGEGPVVFKEGLLRITPLICYEETFSSYAIAAAHLKPNLLVTMSNDCWYPGVRREHFELARLRTVEMGIPLVRSCNQGISAAVDALGRTIASRGESGETQNTCVVTPVSEYTIFSPYAYLSPTFFVACLVALVAAALLQLCFTPKPHQTCVQD